MKGKYQPIFINALTVTEADFQRLTDEAFDEARILCDALRDATVPEGVHYIHAYPPSPMAIAFLAHISPLMDRSARAKVAGSNNNKPRKSRYAGEHAEWRSAALAELHEQPKRSTSKLVTAILARTRTKASRETVRKWVVDKEKSLHREATKARRAGQSWS